MKLLKNMETQVATTRNLRKTNKERRIQKKDGNIPLQGNGKGGMTIFVIIKYLLKICTLKLLAQITFIKQNRKIEITNISLKMK